MISLSLSVDFCFPLLEKTVSSPSSLEAASCSNFTSFIACSSTAASIISCTRSGLVFVFWWPLRCFTISRISEMKNSKGANLKSVLLPTRLLNHRGRASAVKVCSGRTLKSSRPLCTSGSSVSRSPLALVSVPKEVEAMMSMAKPLKTCFVSVIMPPPSFAATLFRYVDSFSMHWLIRPCIDFSLPEVNAGVTIVLCCVLKIMIKRYFFTTKSNSTVFFSSPHPQPTAGWCSTVRGRRLGGVY